MGIHIDTSEVDRLAVDLGQAPARIQRTAPAVMKRGALEVLRGMRKDFSGHRQARGVPLSLEMEPRDIAGLTWQVGEVDSAGVQWGLAAILAYGTSNNAPNTDHTAALRREAPVIEHHLADEGENAVLGAGS
jgi:hypothetical protein